MKTTFIDSSHSYNYGNISYMSVSKVIGKFKPKFDDDFISSRSALKLLLPTDYALVSNKYGNQNPIIIEILKERVDLEEFMLKKMELLNLWDNNRIDKADLGTKFHEKMENRDIAAGFGVNEYTRKEVPLVIWTREYPDFDNEAPFDDISQCQDGYYTEFLIHNHTNQIAGQSDRVFIETIKGVRYVDIGDWKTDKTIDEIPLKYKNQPKMFYPINNYVSTNYNEYSLKISLYAYMFEEYGFTPRNLGFTHVKINENFDIVRERVYRTKYLKSDIINVLDVLKLF